MGVSPRARKIFLRLERLRRRRILQGGLHAMRVLRVSRFGNALRTSGLRGLQQEKDVAGTRRGSKLVPATQVGASGLVPAITRRGRPVPVGLVRRRALRRNAAARI